MANKKAITSNKYKHKDVYKYLKKLDNKDKNNKKKK